jgi:hypothetical protein
MPIHLHKNARTTPVTRAEIAASSDSIATGSALSRLRIYYPPLAQAQGVHRRLAHRPSSANHPQQPPRS